ncbi:uncharacterized protein LOC130703012 [Daphnia carinata]|uniref:uncharacterized protein LOC130703012 n=1 Tax=Daphnia carinata TaxID=120202 RepID=UPI002580A62B|nr:uncharacterized protein LOC130703012 [Daphnia carinata]
MRHLSAFSLGFLFFIFCWLIRYRRLHSLGFADGPYIPAAIFTFAVGTDIRNGTYIFKWQPEPWESVNNQRIFMHGVTDTADLNAKQSCAAESCARHNCNRTIQIFMKMPSSYNRTKEAMELKNPNKNSSLYSVLRHYKNLEIIFFRESEYFRDTALFGWYNKGEWRKSSRRNSHLSVFSSIVSLFRGGGLFIDLDTIITLKPLNGLKWRNFFVKNKEASQTADGVVNMVTSEIFHLVYGHHLSDDIILNLGQIVYDPFSSANDILTAAFHGSMQNICIGENNTSLCRDVKLLDRRDVFLPQFESLMWRQVVLASEEYISTNESKQVGKALQFMIKNIVDDNIASVIQWKSNPNLKRRRNSNSDILYSLLLSQHCPHTVKHFSNELWAS